MNTTPRHLGHVEADPEHKPAAHFKSRQESLNRQSHYSSAAQVRATRAKLVLDELFGSDNVFLNYRKKFAAIKVQASARCSNRGNLAFLEQGWRADGVTIVTTETGTIYRFPKEQA